VTEKLDSVLGVIDTLSPEEQRTVRDYIRRRVPIHQLESEWSTSAEAILAAIARSTDLTQRGIRGILAEAIFEQSIVPQVHSSGWASATITGDQAYDFLISKEGKNVRIQVKLQRKEKQLPKEYAARSRAALDCPTGKIYVAEVQKTRGGEKAGVKTRPYRFGEFDLLAVSMHPSTGSWDKFMFTVGSWLIPRKTDNTLIEIFQPVPGIPDEHWTDDIATAISWFESGVTKQLYKQAAPATGLTLF
jgi:hypothetical protein